MRVNSVLNFNIQQREQLNSTKKYNCLYSDVFIKTSPSFKSNIELDDQSYNAFVSWANSTDFLNSISNDIQNLKGQLIGEGAEGYIYEVPGTDSWVLKEAKNTFLLSYTEKKATTEPARDIIPSMNIGQKIGRIFVPYNENQAQVFDIMKKQTGIPLGIGNEYRGIPTEKSINTHLKTLKILSEAPQSTYDKLISDIKQVHKEGYLFDSYNPNNFLYNQARQSINFVDIGNNFHRNESQFGDILYALLDTTFYQSLNNDKPNEQAAIETSQEYAKNIVNKYIKSMQKEKVEFDYTDLFIKLTKTDLLVKALNCKSNDEISKKLRELNVI